MATSIATRPSVGLMLKASRTLGSAPRPLGLPVLTSRPVQNALFSSTPERQVRSPKRDNNRLRGLSSIYRSGFKRRTLVDDIELPKPTDYKPEAAENVKVDPNHGLWDFFYQSKDGQSKGRLRGLEEISAHGRAWTLEELRPKSWNDLHLLWYACVKERNRLHTANREMSRWRLRNWDDKSTMRERTVWTTMKNIKHTLTVRYYAWEDARELARKDPETDPASLEAKLKSLSPEELKALKDAAEREREEAAARQRQASEVREERDAAEREERDAAERERLERQASKREEAAERRKAATSTGEDSDPTGKDLEGAAPEAEAPSPGQKNKPDSETVSAHAAV